MKMFVVFASASAALLAAPALAQGGGTISGSGAGLSTQDEAPETNEAQPTNGERLICRRVQNDSSTRRTNNRRICRTAQQWREAQRSQ